MRTRALSSLVGIGLFLGLCFGGRLPFTIGVLLLAALATNEFISAECRVPSAESKPSFTLQSGTDLKANEEKSSGTDQHQPPLLSTQHSALSTVFAWSGLVLIALAYLNAGKWGGALRQS